MTKKIILLAIIGLLSGCGTMWKATAPPQSALDQMLLSIAADRAVKEVSATNVKLDANLGKVFINNENFKTTPDEIYVFHALRSRLTDLGVILVDDVKLADTVMDVARGALSIDSSSSLIGLPAMGLPIPFTGTINIPEVALYKSGTSRGLAKLGIALHDAKTGKANGESFITIGTSLIKNVEILVFFKYVTNDFELPKQYESF